MRLGAILDHRQSVAVGEREESIHVDRVPEEMHGDDRLRLRRDQVLDKVEIEIPGDPLGVDRDRHGAVVVRSERRRDVRGCAHEDLVPGRQVECLHREVKCGRTARRGDAVSRTDERGKLSLERGEVLAERA